MNKPMEHVCNKKYHVLRFGQKAKWGQNELPWLAINFDKTTDMNSPGVDFVSIDRFQKDVPPGEFGIYEKVGSDGVLNDEFDEGILRASIVVRPVEKLYQIIEVVFVEKYDFASQNTRLVARYKSPLMQFEFDFVPDLVQKSEHTAEEVKNLSTWNVSMSKVIDSTDDSALVAVQLIGPVVKESKRRHGMAAYMEVPGFKGKLRPYAGKKK